MTSMMTVMRTSRLMTLQWQSKQTLPPLYWQPIKPMSRKNTTLVWMPATSKLKERFKIHHPNKVPLGTCKWPWVIQMKIHKHTPRKNILPSKSWSFRKAKNPGCLYPISYLPPTSWTPKAKWLPWTIKLTNSNPRYPMAPRSRSSSQVSWTDKLCHQTWSIPSSRPRFSSSPKILPQLLHLTGKAPI